jgi:hypothetical protein
MTASWLVLAHAGEGATWQALLTLLAMGLAGVVLLTVFGAVRIGEPGDLVLPLAGTAVLASLSGATSEVLSDWVGWWFPIGVVALLALVVAATTPLDLTLRTPLFYGAVAIAVMAAFVLHTTIERAWHPLPAPMAAAAPVGRLEVTIVAPEDRATVPAGEIELVVAVTGGTIGDGFLPDAERVDGAVGDPQELVVVRIFLDGLQVLNGTAPVAPVEACGGGCAEATYRLEVTPGEHSLLVDVMTADGRVFEIALGGDNPTSDRVLVTAE